MVQPPQKQQQSTVNLHYGATKIKDLAQTTGGFPINESHLTSQTLTR